jgi:ApaG protein
MLGAIRCFTAASLQCGAVDEEKPAGRKGHEVLVSSQTQYLPDQSDEAASRYVFAYTITLRNEGTVAAQLISRHWIITDAQGLVQEVRGLGVVGSQPLIQPGTMRGTYQMLGQDGTRFEAPIPQFTLSVPRVLH